MKNNFMEFSKYHLKNISEDEAIVKIVHRNWFYLLQQYFLLFLIVGLFLGATISVPTLFPQFLGNINEPAMLFVQNFFMLAVWIYGFLIWIDYYFDIWIITSERIINIEQKGMFNRRVSEMTYSKIQDISTEVKGFIPTIINYGDLKIQTAGEEEEFIFRTVSDPYMLKNIIMEMQRQSSISATEQLGEMIKEKIQS